MLVVNKIPAVFDEEEVRERVEQTYDCPVAAVISHSEEMMTLASADIFVLRYPKQPITAKFKHLADALMEA